MALIRVFEIPSFPSGFVHGGRPAKFVEVDWFRDDAMPLNVHSEAEYREFLSMKSYIRPGNSYLVLHPHYCFTVNYDAP